VLFAFVVLPATAFSAPKAKDKIVVGMSRPLSGWNAMIGDSAFRPVYETWVKEVNAQGGILRHATRHHHLLLPASLPRVPPREPPIPATRRAAPNAPATCPSGRQSSLRSPSLHSRSSRAYHTMHPAASLLHAQRSIFFAHMPQPGSRPSSAATITSLFYLTIQGIGCQNIAYRSEPLSRGRMACMRASGHSESARKSEQEIPWRVSSIRLKNTGNFSSMLVQIRMYMKTKLWDNGSNMASSK